MADAFDLMRMQLGGWGDAGWGYPPARDSLSYLDQVLVGLRPYSFDRRLQEQQAPATSFIEFARPETPRQVDVGTGIPLSTDRAQVVDNYTGTALEQLVNKLGDIGTAIPGLAELVNKGALNTLGFRQPDGDIYRSEIPVAPGATAAADALTMLTGGLTAPLAPAVGAFRLGARSALPMAREAAASGALASRNPMLYNPPVKPPRPFAADYPAGAPTDATGRLLADIEGRPLDAAHVAGRRALGEADVALTPAQLQSVGEGSVGAVYKAQPAGTFRRGVVGEYDPLEQTIRLRGDISPAQGSRLLQHETAHLIDEVAGQVPTGGIVRELRQVYNTLNTGAERTRHLTGPEHMGYRAGEQPRELMAEAIRAYMADPNYLKTVAPNVAARIREAVNANPTLRPWVQFNTAAPFGLGLLAPDG